ncbi:MULTISPECIES: DUF1854 domain-containing protein [Paenibacillus]|uniref:DUF1854 domain-containing protein n=1 Tax=Paenibacillus TaxID=44249 RepID=UPI00203B8969|nr:DUF1854 domain-containing protein [Paenibacillus camelliae]MCM3632715.1 DUF1854 domain-containing protein [Paenibacillus camelliae]
MSAEDIRMLSSEELYVYRGEGGVLQGIVDGKTYHELLIFLTFPMRYTSEYVSIRTKDGNELGIVRSLAGLDRDSAAVLKEEIELRYFLPRVTKIESIKQRSDLWFWELQTHLGSIRIIMRNLHDHIQFPGGDRILLSDLDGRRCDIVNWRQLDAHSQRLLRDIL